MRNPSRRTGLPPAAVLVLVLAGCAASGPEPVPTEPETAAVPAPEPAPPASPEAAPSPRPQRAEVALVLDTSTASHAAVADAIEVALPPRQYRVERFSASATGELDALRDRRVTMVAVGPRAVQAARAAAPNAPLVFCQVLEFAEVLQAGGPTWGVQTLPPLELQLESWLAVDPSLRTIALIVGASGAALAEEARRAATSRATDLVVETSTSDRETLYLFRRLAAAVDGLWLLPDNDALSPQALREILGYASSRGIGVLTFNEALLSRGALLTATAVPADVAAAVARVVEHVVAGRTAELPSMTPLSAAELAVNADTATALGLPPVAIERWVVHEHD